jgi:endonuclease YncB( thermonuclease family)
LSRRYRSPTSWRSTSPLRTRPLWRTAVDAGGFVLVLAVVMITLDRAGFLDVGTGGYQVVDGDSLRHGATEVRLYGIDAVEYNQHCSLADGRDYACGREATASMRDLIRGRTISCKAMDQDRYGRTVALCGDGRFDLNQAQVRAGWAVAYRTHTLAYVSAEQDARREKRGIWAGRFDQPEDYRARNRRADGMNADEGD